MWYCSSSCLREGFLSVQLYWKKICVKEPHISPWIERTLPRALNLFLWDVSLHSPHRVTWLPAMPLVIMRHITHHITGRVISAEGIGFIAVDILNHLKYQTCMFFIYLLTGSCFVLYHEWNLHVLSNKRVVVLFHESCVCCIVVVIHLLLL